MPLVLTRQSEGRGPAPWGIQCPRHGQSLSRCVTSALLSPQLAGGVGYWAWPCGFAMTHRPPTSCIWSLETGLPPTPSMWVSDRGWAADPG